MVPKLHEQFLDHLEAFFTRTEEMQKYEVRTLEAQNEILRTNIRTLMTIIHKQFESGNISEEIYKMACLVYSMGNSETFNIKQE